MAGEAIAGASRDFRLDPYSLPARGAANGGIAGAGFIIEADRAIVLDRRSADPDTASLSVPLSSYRGVSVRMEAIGSEGAIRVYVELLHKDSALTLPLIVGDTPEDVVADWEAWGRTLNLPLLVIGQDGSVSDPLTTMGGVLSAPTKPRRRHSFFAGRRPRFLTRRRTGQGSPTERLAGREIIARN